MCVEHTDEHPSIVVKREKGVPHARYMGLLTCGHIWTCPVCSQNLRAKRAARIAGAVGHLGGRWQMLTITVRHRKGLDLKPLRDGLAVAWRKTRQGGRIQRVWTERVSASVRAQEVTFGDNGWHPHIHVLIRTTEWEQDELDALQARWERNVVAALGEHARPDDLHGMVWSAPLDASKADEVERALYLTKAGFELSGVAKDTRERRSKSPWDLARDAARGDSRSLLLWREFYAATKGRRAIELDDRAAAAAKRAEEVESANHEEGEGDALPLHIEVQRDEIRALRRLERSVGAIMAIVLRAAEDDGASGVREWIVYAREHHRGAPRPLVKARAGPHATAGPLTVATL